MHNNNINFPLASTAPSVIPSGNLPANRPLGDFVSEGVTQNSVKLVTEPAGEAPRTVSVPEGVANDSNIQDASDEEVGRLIESTGNPPPIAAGEWEGGQTNDMVENELSATGRPRRNVGNYRQGPAKIRRLPINREQYDFSFSVLND